MYEIFTIIFVFGDKVFIAVAIPAKSPPPPTGTTTASASTTCSAISKPIVPCPAYDVENTLLN